MPAYKDTERGTWYVQFYYEDWTGKRRKKKKRGFARKKDAEAYEEEFLRKGARTCDMTFGSMTELYLADMKPRLKLNTYRTKEYLINGKILPFFKDLRVNEIIRPTCGNGRLVLERPGHEDARTALRTYGPTSSEAFEKLDNLML